MYGQVLLKNILIIFKKPQNSSKTHVAPFAYLSTWLCIEV